MEGTNKLISRPENKSKPNNNLKIEVRDCKDELIEKYGKNNFSTNKRITAETKLCRRYYTKGEDVRLRDGKDGIK